MREQPLNEQYKQAMIQQMGGSLGMQGAELQERIRQNQINNQLAREKMALEQEEMGIRNSLLGLQQRELDQKARLTDAEIAQKTALTNRLNTIQNIKGSIQIGGIDVPARVFDPTDLARMEVASRVAEQKEDPGKVFDEMYKEQLKLARPGDKQAAEKARLATIEYMKMRFGPEIAAKYSWGAGRVSGKNPFGF